MKKDEFKKHAKSLLTDSKSYETTIDVIADELYRRTHFLFDEEEYPHVLMTASILRNYLGSQALSQEEVDKYTMVALAYRTLEKEKTDGGMSRVKKLIANKEVSDLSEALVHENGQEGVTPWERCDIRDGAFIRKVKDNTKRLIGYDNKHKTHLREVKLASIIEMTLNAYRLRRNLNVLKTKSSIDPAGFDIQEAYFKVTLAALREFTRSTINNEPLIRLFDAAKEWLNSSIYLEKQRTDAELKKNFPSHYAKDILKHFNELEEKLSKHHINTFGTYESYKTNLSYMDKPVRQDGNLSQYGKRLLQIRDDIEDKLKAHLKSFDYLYKRFSLLRMKTMEELQGKMFQKILATTQQPGTALDVKLQNLELIERYPLPIQEKKKLLPVYYSIVSGFSGQAPATEDISVLNSLLQKAQAAY
ncbi:hypothetical protein JXA85_04880, partial [Candidatus Woesearchaeota archaeon]|nr:hypothetical protein [Candidatus Woesearchaeota archaeon]